MVSLKKLYSVASRFLFGGALLAVAIPLSAALYQASTETPIFIEPFGVPKSLQDEGNTGRVLAQKLMDKLNEIELTIDAARKGKSFLGAWSERTLDVEVKGAKVSVVMDTIRDALGRHASHVVGEIVSDGPSQLILTTRVDNGRTRVMKGNRTLLDSMLLDAALDVYRRLRPSDLAWYYLEIAEKDSCLAAIHEAVRNEEPEEQAWGYAIWGTLLRSEKTYRQAEDQYRRAIEFQGRMTGGDSGIDRAVTYAHYGLAQMFHQDLSKSADALVLIEAAMQFKNAQVNLIHLQKGWILYDRGDLEGSTQIADDVLRRDPRNAAAHLLRGRILASEGRLDAALKEFLAAARLERYLTQAYNDAIWTFLVLDRPDEADLLITEGEKQMGERAALQIEAGAALRDGGALDKAERRFGKAIAIADRSAKRNRTWSDEDASNAYQGFARVLEERENYLAAHGAYVKAIRRHKRDAMAYIGAGRMLVQLAQYDGARTMFKAADMNAPRSAAVATAWGTWYAAQGKTDEAMAWFENALHLNKWYANAYSERGKLLRTLGMRDGAISEFRRAVYIQPWGSYRFDLAEELRADGRFDVAAYHFEELLKRDPHHFLGYQRYGWTLDARGDHSGAKQQYERGLRFYPTSAGLHADLGDALAGEDDTAGAERQYKRAVALDGRDVYPRLRWGLFHEGRGRFREAKEQYRQALTLNRRNVEALFLLGRLQRRTGELKQATENLETVGRLDTRYLEARRELGLTYRDRGDVGRALTVLSEACELKNAAACKDAEELRRHPTTR